MPRHRSLTVDLPDGLEATADDLDVLRSTFQTILSLTRQCGMQPCEQLRDMLDKGWTVNWEVVWLARAQRGKSSEETTGRTREEALEQLRQAVCLHEADGCP